MNRRNLVVTAGIAALVVGAGGVVLAQGGRSLLFHGNVVSSGVRVIDGTPYVPAADVARALGGHLKPHGDGFEVVTAGAPGQPAGGANEVRGLNGKVGDWFFNGYWRFQVVSMERMPEYTFKYQADAETDKPKGANDELVVFTCHLKNAQNDSQEPVLTIHGTGVQNTALTDDQGQSYAPYDFDQRGGSMVPGSGKTFTVLFSVPKGTNLQTFIFTMYGYGRTSDKPTSVRVSLDK